MVADNQKDRQLAETSVRTFQLHAVETLANGIWRSQERGGKRSEH